MNTAEIVAVTESWINTKDGNMTADEFIAYVARVSNPSNQMNSESAPKLLRYLVKHNHWSPFEMVHIVMEINTTRDIARQILRHRSFTFQEFSQRYADATRSLGFSHREARLQDTKNRQNSLEITDTDLETAWRIEQQHVIERAVLPEGLTNSRLYMSGSLRSWIHYCQLRASNGTQKEHREIAIDCWYQLMEHFSCLEDIGLTSE